jgi:hypothetical protein
VAIEALVFVRLIMTGCSFVANPVVAVNLSNVRIEQYGNLHLPQDIAYVQNIVNST